MTKWLRRPGTSPGQRRIGCPPESVPDFLAGVDSAWPYKAPVLDSESDTGSDVKSGAKGIGARAAPEGEFIEGTYTNHAGTRSYKLYIPVAYHGQALPLIVMLHGCSQDPDDFAAGTRMNTIAGEKIASSCIRPRRNPQTDRVAGTGSRH